MLECLNHMEEFDPEGARLTELRIWKEFAEAAGVTIARLKLAYRRVAWDGIYGPIDDEAWEQSDGERMSMVDAKKILHAALEHTPEVRYTHPDYGYMCKGTEEGCTHEDHAALEDEGPLFHEEPITVESARIWRDVFPAILQIYGGRI